MLSSKEQFKMVQNFQMSDEKMVQNCPMHVPIVPGRAQTQFPLLLSLTVVLLLHGMNLVPWQPTSIINSMTPRPAFPSVSE